MTTVTTLLVLIRAGELDSHLRGLARACAARTAILDKKNVELPTSLPDDLLAIYESNRPLAWGLTRLHALILRGDLDAELETLWLECNRRQLQVDVDGGRSR